MFIRLDDWIARIKYIERYFPRVGIDRGLHRVAHVICAVCEPGYRKRGGIGMREGSRIAVHHPNQSAVIGNHEIRVLIPSQKARKILQSFLHVSVNHHAALPGEVTRENNVWLALGDRSGGLQQKRSDREASRALVSRIFILVAGGVVKFFASGVDEYGILGLFAVINFRSSELKARGLD